MVSTVGPLTTSWSGRLKMVSWWSGGGTRRDLAVPSSVPALAMENSRLIRVSSWWDQSVLLLAVHNYLHYQVTASRGEESHFFLKADNRRVHYTGHTKVFMVRSYTHTAGFDEAGNLRIYWSFEMRKCCLEALVVLFLSVWKFVFIRYKILLQRLTEYSYLLKSIIQSQKY